MLSISTCPPSPRLESPHFRSLFLIPLSTTIVQLEHFDEGVTDNLIPALYKQIPLPLDRQDMILLSLPYGLLSPPILNTPASHLSM